MLKASDRSERGREHTSVWFPAALVNRVGFLYLEAGYNNVSRRGASASSLIVFTPWSLTNKLSVSGVFENSDEPRVIRQKFAFGSQRGLAAQLFN